MTPESLDSTPTHACRGILWLVVAHVAVGVFAALMMRSMSDSDLAIGTWWALWNGQTILLGIWCGLGTSGLWRKLIGVILGAVVLCLTFGFALDVLSVVPLVFLAVAIPSMAIPFLIARCIGIATVSESSPISHATRLQFSIRQLLVLTFLVACVVSFGKMVQPYLVNPHRQVILVVGDYAVLYVAVGAIVTGVAAFIPAWLILATKRPVPYGIGLVAIPACLGCCLSWIINSPKASGVAMTVLTTPALVVVVSLLVVRFSGCRLVRLPRSTPRGSGLEEITTRQVGNRDSQSSSLSQ